MTTADDASPRPPPPLPTYAAPQELPYATPTLIRPYASVRRTARVIVWLSWGQIVLQLPTLWPVAESVMHYEVDGFSPWSWDLGVLGEMTAGDIVDFIVGLMFGALFTAATVFWMVWVYGAYRNLRPLGAEALKYSPGWAVGYHFIPVLNLFRPLQVMRETWKASDPAHPGGTAWREVTTPALLGWWWALRLGSLAVYGAFVWTWTRTEEFQILRVIAWGQLGMLVVEAAILLLEIRIVRRLTDLQERRADTVVGFAEGATGAPVPQPVAPLAT